MKKNFENSFKSLKKKLYFELKGKFYLNFNNNNNNNNNKSFAGKYPAELLMKL
jgi:hypothetical protein